MNRASRARAGWTLSLLAFAALFAGCGDDLTDRPDAAVPACRFVYDTPGCGAAPRCERGCCMDLCLSLVCSCTGIVLGGCDYFGEPYTTLGVPKGAMPGDRCSTDGGVGDGGAP